MTSGSQNAVTMDSALTLLSFLCEQISESGHYRFRCTHQFYSSGFQNLVTISFVARIKIYNSGNGFQNLSTVDFTVCVEGVGVGLALEIRILTEFPKRFT